MDKVFANTKTGQIEYEKNLDNVEIEISRQEIEKLPSEWIKEKIKEIVYKLMDK